MQVSCDEGVASHVDPESCGDDRKVVVEALTGERAGRVLSLENLMLRGADAVLTGGRQQRAVRQRENRPHPAWSETPRTHRSTSRGSREIPWSVRADLGELSRAVARTRAANPKGVRRR